MKNMHYFNFTISNDEYVLSEDYKTIIINGFKNDISIKDKYWKAGNIVVTRYNGPSIISNKHYAFAKNGIILSSALDSNLLANNRNYLAMDIIAIYKVPNEDKTFDFFDENELKRHCECIYKNNE